MDPLDLLPAPEVKDYKPGSNPMEAYVASEVRKLAEIWSVILNCIFSLMICYLFAKLMLVLIFILRCRFILVGIFFIGN